MDAIKDFLNNFLQNKYADAQVLNDLLLDLRDKLVILREAFLFKGSFCPMFEHRQPEFSKQDGDGVKSMSPAQRAYQFKSIGLNSIKICRRIIYITPPVHAQKIVQFCKEITQYLTFRKTKESKMRLEILTNNLMRFLVKESDLPSDLEVDTDLNDAAEKMSQFVDKLDEVTPEELPNMAYNKWTRWGINLAIALCLWAFLVFIIRQTKETFYSQSSYPQSGLIMEIRWRGASNGGSS